MIYQVTANILFDNEDESKDFYHDCEIALAKGVSINTSQPNMETGHISRNVSNHELDPNQESIVLESETKP